MPIEVRRWVRRMRGGAQAHLVEAADGAWYVLKARCNPQHRRILINEWVAATVFRYLELNTPPTAILSLSEEALLRHPELSIQLGSRFSPIRPGWHFGSQFPGHPDRIAVFDFLPDVFLKQTANSSELLGAFVADKLLANLDARQAIFYRARLAGDPDAPPENVRAGYVASMIDHGYCLGGPDWVFRDSPLHGIYVRRCLYETVRGWADFEPWLERARHLPEAVLDQALRQIPLDWFEGDRDVLEALLGKLIARRKRIADLIEDAARSPNVSLFPNWR